LNEHVENDEVIHCKVKLLKVWQHSQSLIKAKSRDCSPIYPYIYIYIYIFSPYCEISDDFSSAPGLHTSVTHPPWSSVALLVPAPSWRALLRTGGLPPAAGAAADAEDADTCIKKVFM
jgi:hypothetical protein